jgi:hypothetical protein
MSNMESPIAKWSGQGEMHLPGDEGSQPQESGKSSLPSPSHEQIQPVLGTRENELAWPCGDNPSEPSVSGLPNQGDQRNFSGGSKSDPAPAMPGA